MVCSATGIAGVVTGVNWSAVFCGQSCACGSFTFQLILRWWDSMSIEVCPGSPWSSHDAVVKLNTVCIGFRYGK